MLPLRCAQGFGSRAQHDTACPFKLTRTAHLNCTFSLADSLQITTNQPFYNDYVAPGVIELAMLFVNSNFAKTKRTNELPTGGIFNKDARNQFPNTCRF